MYLEGILLVSQAPLVISEPGNTQGPGISRDEDILV